MALWVRALVCKHEDLNLNHTLVDSVMHTPHTRVYK